MKISYRNYPILEKLHNRSLGVIPMFEIDKPFFDLHMNGFVKTWKFHNNSFRNEINFITKPFMEACEKAEDKLRDLWLDILKNDSADFDVKGCYIFGDTVYMVDYEVKRGSQDQELSLYVFNKDGIPLLVFIDSAKYKTYQEGWVSNLYSSSIKKTESEIQHFIYSTLLKVVIFKMFKTYAEVETKEIAPNSKTKTIDCKYVNDTNFKITYLDSKWFTNLVKSDAFKVRGHFRLQPCGEGLKDRKLIWINDFEKSGYTAHARKLSATSH